MIHFAGLKAVGESVANPRRYFDNNLIGTINLYEVMAKYECKKVCLQLNFLNSFDFVSESCACNKWFGSESTIICVLKEFFALELCIKCSF